MGNYESVPKDCAVVTATAPGRVNLIGEHTDYNGGFVLPTTIPQHTQVELALRSDHTVSARSKSMDPVEGTYSLGQEHPRGDWLDYVQGLTWALREAGFSITAGFELSITSDVPPGAGLS